MKFDVLFRVDADQKIGIGHMRRCQALSEGFKRAGLKKFAFATRTPETFREWYGSKYTLFKLNADTFSNEVAEIKQIASKNNFNYTVIDRYGISTSYLKRLKEFLPRLVSLNDDVVLDDYPVDVVINYNVYARRLRYPSSTRAKLFLGLPYVPVREEFRKKQPSGKKTGLPRVFVALGGYARQAHLNKIRRALEQACIPMEVSWASGRTRHVAKAMDGADLAITAGGVTTYELASLGIPAIIVILAQNQKRIAEAWHCQGNAVNLGELRTLSAKKIAKTIEELLNSTVKRRQMSRKAIHLIDGQGADRLVSKLKQHFGGSML